MPRMPGLNVFQEADTAIVSSDSIKKINDGVKTILGCQQPHFWHGALPGKVSIRTKSMGNMFQKPIRYRAKMPKIDFLAKLLQV